MTPITYKCAACGSSFTPTARQRKRHGSGDRNGGAACCSDVCRRTRSVGAPRKHPVEFGPCPTCGSMFRSKAPKKFCSMKCYTSSEQFIEQTRSALRKAAASAGRSPEPNTKECPGCGERFKSKPTGPKFCKGSCRRSYFAARYDRWFATPETIALPQGYDEFLSQDELPCLVEGCEWFGQLLSNHMNFAHGVPASEFKKQAGFGPRTGVVGALARAAMESREHIKLPSPWLANAPRGNRSVGRSLEGLEKISKSRSEAATAHVCIVCGDDFVSRSNAKSGERGPKYCTRRCLAKASRDARKARAGAVHVACDECGTAFRPSLQQEPRAARGIPVFCSLACRQTRNGRVGGATKRALAAMPSDGFAEIVVKREASPMPAGSWAGMQPQRFEPNDPLGIIEPALAIDLDGMFHFKGECCNGIGDRRCRACGDVLHLQGAYHGMIEACETCAAAGFKLAVRDDSDEGARSV